MSSSEQIESKFNEFVMPTYSPNLALVRGKGTRVWDADGKVYLDFGCGISVVNVGHCHPAVVKAISEQAGKLMHVSNLYYTENEAELAEKLANLSMQGKAFFCNSGAEANEGLIKLARLWGQGRYEVICMQNSFHGRTLATAAATGQDKVKKGFEPMPEGFVHADFNDIDSVAALVTDKTAAVLLEPVLGEGGVIPADPEFMYAIRSLCDEKNILMLCDEVQCGMGRTGNWFAYQGYEVTPDAFSLAKALGSGYPIGAIVAGPKLADVFQPGKHASTFGGTPLACAAALATLQVIEEEGLLERASQAGIAIMEALAGFVDEYEHVSEARGRGLMLGMVLDRPAKALVDKMTDVGLLTLATAENVVRMLPPLNVKDSEIEEAIDIMDECLAEWHGVSSDEDDLSPASAGSAVAEESFGDEAEKPAMETAGAAPESSEG